MDRRNFIKLTGAGLLLAACNWEKAVLKAADLSFKIHVDSNRNVGHLIRGAMELPIHETITTDTVVVGGGIAGMAAATTLKDQDFLLLELNDELGGTSGAKQIAGRLIGQGAHYDLAYPETYGSDGLALLKQLEIVQFNKKAQLWEFADTQHLVKSEVEEQCYFHGEMRSSVHKNDPLYSNFTALMSAYEGQFPLPSTLISGDLHPLDQTNFYDYLNKYLPITDEFIQAIDYQMLDDYGGTSREVSALAGIHYYMCRPYYDKDTKVQLFSAEEGNHYFISKMAAAIPAKKLKRNALAFKLVEHDNGVSVDYYDVTNKTRIRVEAKKVIYAGQKHALKYIHPPSYSNFSTTKYAPWVIVNLVLKSAIENKAIWQNDFISTNNDFLGFVDSAAQNKDDQRVLTCFFCFKDIHHFVVQDIESNADKVCTQAIESVNKVFGLDIGPLIEEAHVKLLGHAMAVPGPGYLTQPRSDNGKILFAGADSGRLPLMFDALDSGIQAAKKALVSIPSTS